MSWYTFCENDEYGRFICSHEEGFVWNQSGASTIRNRNDSSRVYGNDVIIDNGEYKWAIDGGGEN